MRVSSSNIERLSGTNLHRQLKAAFEHALHRAAAPKAEFATVPAARQAKVALEVQASLTAHLSGAEISLRRKDAVRELIAFIGQPDFYDRLGAFDKTHRAKWNEMTEIQREFAVEEPKYDPKTRAYSESMRLTLQASAVLHFAQPGTNKGSSLYARFLALHPTAFHQNGGWVDNLQIPVTGAIAVLEATPMAMWKNTLKLLKGAHIADAPTVDAAQMVREARRAAIKGWR